MSDVNLTLQDNGGVYLAITETPAVVTLGQAVISGALASSVTVTNVVSVNVVTMPAISVTPAAVTTVAGTVSISNFPASSSVTIANFPSVTTVTGTVALDQASLIALENVTVTVGSTVSISNLPATQTIAGTVTANISGQYYSGNGDEIWPISVGKSGEDFNVGHGRVAVEIVDKDGNSLIDSPAISIGIRGTVTANVPNLLTQDQEGKAFYGVAIGYNNENDDIFHNVSEASPLPVAGTVTANVSNLIVQVNSDNSAFGVPIVAYNGDNDVFYHARSSNIGHLQTDVVGCVTHGVNVANSITIGSLPTISGTVTANIPVAGAAGGNLLDYNGANSCLNIGIQKIGSVSLNAMSSLPVAGTVSIGNTITANVSGTVTAAVASTTVTVSAMPSGTLTTRFGTPTTANTAFLTSAVTNTARKYLLIQNVTTASNVITVGVGFVPTTTQGIQLAAGAGITFESSYIPTGAVWVLSSVTASNHTILEA